MKKKVLFIVLGVVLFFLIVGTIGVMAIINMANKQKTPITSSDFKTTMESKGYVVTDATSQFSGYDYVKKVYVAQSSDASYQIEFYQMSDESYAATFYSNNKSIFASSAGTSTGNTEFSGKNYSKYSLTSNGKYQYISRIDNTVVYLSVDSSYVDNAKDIVKKLGY